MVHTASLQTVNELGSPAGERIEDQILLGANKISFWPVIDRVELTARPPTAEPSGSVAPIEAL